MTTKPKKRKPARPPRMRKKGMKFIESYSSFTDVWEEEVADGTIIIHRHEKRLTGKRKS